jgi:predicted lysophospholipase L1 biosynthesis ABC-type transport system permease subunit
VPVILEKNTANYSLNLWGGLGETFAIKDGHGRPLTVEVVALLADSIFQGDLLMSEPSFLRCFPDTSGCRFFLIETPPDQTAAVQKALERNLGDYGLAVETTGQRMAGFLTVQNTYLSTFQSLGGLGLLLGTLGLAAVQLRAVLERRGELALLQAVGFRRRSLAFLVMFEHAALLLAGLAIGAMSAFVAVLPQVQVRATSLPWPSLAGTLLAVFLLGLLTGLLAVRAVLRAPLLPALREEM